MRSIAVTAIIAATFMTSASATHCMDSPTKIAWDGEGEKYFYCDDERIYPGSELCEDEFIWSHCPSACDRCDARCMDSDAIFLTPKGEGRELNCEELSEMGPKQLRKKCRQYSALEETCRETCNYCTKNFVFFPLVDSHGKDIGNFYGNGTVGEWAARCEDDDECEGFNTDAWLKKFIRPQSDWYEWECDDDISCGIFVKKEVASNLLQPGWD